MNKVLKCAENFIISFNLLKKGEIALIKSKNEKAIEIKFKDSLLNVKIYYRHGEKIRALNLNSIAYLNDKIEIKVMPYRLELIVNGKIEDEEWSFGEALYKESDEIIGDVLVAEFTPEKINLPSVIGTFKNAEGWRPEENVYVGDCMPYTYEDKYHVLYLKDRHNHRSKFGKGAHQWEHVSTSDFIKWDIHPMAVEITETFEGSVCTGSFIASDEKKYLYYTIRMSDGSSAPIMRSFSFDGYHFEKDKDFKFYLSDKYTGESARDPKVIKDNDGIYHMFVTSTLISANKGALVHLTSKDAETWVEKEEPIYISPNRDEPECSDYFEYKGYYYLVFSLGGRGNYLYSKKPFSEWITPEDPYIPCKTVPKAAVFGGKIIFTGYNNLWNELYAGTMAFKIADAKEDGQLIFE